jgi:hypothetical protein
VGGGAVRGLSTQVGQPVANQDVRERGRAGGDDDNGLG